MAVKVSQLTQISSPENSDYLYVSQPSGGGYVSRRLSYADLVSKLRTDITPSGLSVKAVVTEELSHGAFWDLAKPGGSLSTIFNCRSIVHSVASPTYAQPLYTADGVNSYVLKVKNVGSSAFATDVVDLYSIEYLPDSTSSDSCPYMVDSGSGTEADPYTYVKSKRLNPDAELPQYKWIKNNYSYIFLGANESRWLKFSGYRAVDASNPNFYVLKNTSKYIIDSVAGKHGMTCQLFRVTASSDFMSFFDM